MSAFLTDADYHWRRPWHRRAFSLVARTRLPARRRDRDDVGGRGRRSGRRSSASRATAFTSCTTRSTSTRLPRRSASRSTRRTTRPGRIRLIVAAGRLADAKNYPLLIDALAVLRAAHAGAAVHPRRGRARGRASRRIVGRLGLDDAVVFCGFQRNPWKYIARADVFALTLALRRIRQRAGRSDGVRRAGRGDELAGHARDRRPTESTACWSTPRTGSARRGAASASWSTMRCGAAWRRRRGAARSGLHCRDRRGVRPRLRGRSRELTRARPDPACAPGPRSLPASRSASRTCSRRLTVWFAAAMVAHRAADASAASRAPSGAG